MKLLPAALLRVLGAVAALAPVALRSAPLAATAAIQTRADPAAPVIGYLKAGTEPISAAAAPEGWVAVSVPGPFEAYVRDSDFNKALEVKAGSSIYLQPSAESGVLAIAAKGDKIEITGLHGKWTQIRLSQPVIGYVGVGPAAAVSTVPVEAPAPVAVANNEPGRAAPVGAAPDAEAPRLFEGRVVSTHHLFEPRRPYAWELDTIGGARLVYLDFSHLLLTDQLDSYAGHDVLVSGPAHPVPGTADLVISVESLRLK